MEIDPLELAGEEPDRRDAGRLNTLVAATVAVLATFMAICEVKSGSLDQGMQRLQIEKNDTWAWYQARNIRQEVLETAGRQFRALAAIQPEASRAPLIAAAEEHKALAKSQQEKMVALQDEAKGIEARYDVMDRRGDQLDLEAASLSIAISLLAMTALTRKRWLFGVALVPIALGLVMGLAGLFNWGIRADFLTGWLAA